MPKDTSLTYRRAGVDIAAGNALVKRIAPLAKSTARQGADGALGGFGGLFDLKKLKMDDPILVAATDGVGTKLKVAIECARHETIGIDLVAMCVNDLIVQGAEPLFFLDYLATAKLDLAVAEAVISGIAEGCRQAGCALIGGESAEMPGLYAGGDYDLAGFAVGAVARAKLLPRADIAEGDMIFGLASDGVHANGFSLIRQIIASGGHDLAKPPPFDHPADTLADALLTPTRIYVKPVLEALRVGIEIKALAHITGGGLTENLPRILPQSCAAEIDLSNYPLPPIFQWLKAEGNITDDEMRRTFNCGIGMVLIISEQYAGRAALTGERVIELGRIIARKDAPICFSDA